MDTISDFVSPMYRILQAQANLDYTRESTKDQQALATQRQLNAQQTQLDMQERQATQQVLLRSLQGGDRSQDPTTDITDADTPISASQKNVRRLQNEAQKDRQLAAQVVQAGGSLEYAEKLKKDASDSTNRAIQAQHQLRLDQKTLAQDIGGIAGTARDQESFDNAYRRIAELDSVLARSLSVDRDANGAPIWGPKSQRQMQGLFTGSMTAAQQMDRQLKVEEEMRKQADDARKVEDDKRKLEETDSRIALNRSRAKAEEALATERTEKGQAAKDKAARVAAVASKPATPAMKKSAADVVSAADWEGKKWDSTIDAFSADVADKANKIRADALKSGEDIGLDDARQQAIDELRPFVKDKMVGEHDVMGFKWGGEAKKTYVRGKAPVDDKSVPQISSKEEYDKLKKGDKYIWNGKDGTKQ